MQVIAVIGIISALKPLEYIDGCEYPHVVMMDGFMAVEIFPKRRVTCV
jgi:hypothetical protein